ncbi:hypothetical protein BpHYR1_038528 [Brachionus plicatilis]|uniref:Uncharacterized protein n=1 Tax=Brachionus plicatilis TaxID=10195 RepID=A0A3M7QT31_BRAPC|nr:hypothetical protein BpHYR1_038528 [Brachionus plicatilis]
MASPSDPILFNEAVALILPITLTDHSAYIYTSITGNAMIGLWQRVRAKWTRFFTTESEKLHHLPSLIIFINWSLAVKSNCVSYMLSAGNPADAPSRRKAPCAGFVEAGLFNMF